VPSAPDSSPPSDEERRLIARTAILATFGLYLGYAGLKALPWPARVAESLAIVLIAGFYFLPGWLLRRRPELAARWQVGPDGPIPPWSRAGWRWAAIAGVALLPLFALLTWAFYFQVCQGDAAVLQPVIAVESRTPVAGNLEQFLGGQCRRWSGGFWPDRLQLPATWVEYYGLGFLRDVAIGVFAIALPEEVFHRGYLMSALEQRWPPTRKLLGVPFGWAAVISSMLFALGHVAVDPDTAKLATFFPALAFAWLWRRTGSLWAPALFHAGCNLWMNLLIASTFAGP